MSDDQNRAACGQCGKATERDMVSMSLWAPSGLVVVEDVPAHVCVACGEQYYDDPTQARLRELASGGFSRKGIVREISVPVYSLAQTSDDPQEEVEEGYSV